MSIHLITGCMFSGKTTALINAAKMNKLLNKKVLMINYNLDNRYSSSDKMITHDLISVDCLAFEKDLLKCAINSEVDVICINEGQFFENLVVFCTGMCNIGKEIYVCGLDGDYLKRPFGEILNLVPHCDTVTKMYALCMNCRNGTKACFTKKISNSNSLIEIGSSEIYMPVCRKCY
jgi:thymidine kinase